MTRTDIVAVDHAGDSLHVDRNKHPHPTRTSPRPPAQHAMHRGHSPPDRGGPAKPAPSSAYDEVRRSFRFADGGQGSARTPLRGWDGLRTGTTDMGATHDSCTWQTSSTESAITAAGLITRSPLLCRRRTGA